MRNIVDNMFEIDTNASSDNPYTAQHLN